MTSSSVVGIAALLAATACGDRDADDENIAERLNQPNGGYNDSTEAPAFGDSDAKSMPTFSRVSSALSVTPPAVAADGRRFRVVVLWGRLPFWKDDEPGQDRHDWTGSLSVDGASTIGDLSTVRFDDKDSVSSRTSSSVSFTSHTRPHVDGLFVEIVLAPGAPETLHFDTPSLKKDLDLGFLRSDVGSLDPIDDGSGLLFAGYEELASCTRGLMFGKWRSKSSKRGRFAGTVLGGNGNGDGHVIGIFGRPKGSKDESLFFGKYVGPSGEPRALLGGTADDGRAHGAITLFGGGHGSVEVLASEGGKRGVWIGRYSRCE